MAFKKESLDDYVEVKDRIILFYEKYPEGSIQSEVTELTSSRVTVKAYAYRSPTDPHPGVGHSYMNIPGSTPYTKGSEIENAETSAWGRALAALGFEVKKSVASADEIAAKKVDPDSGILLIGSAEATAKTAEKRQPTLATDAQRKMVRAEARKLGLDGDNYKAFVTFVTGKYSSLQLTMDDVDTLLSKLKNDELVRDFVEAKVGDEVSA